MTTVPIAFSGNYLAQLWVWNWSNPIAFLTAVMVCITAYYAHATTKYVSIAAKQFAAQIEPFPTITLREGAWSGGHFLGELVIAAAQNSMVVMGGLVLLRFEHGYTKVVGLNEWFGHTLSPGQQLVLCLDMEFGPKVTGHL